MKSLEKTLAIWVTITICSAIAWVFAYIYGFGNTSDSHKFINDEKFYSIILYNTNNQVILQYQGIAMQEKNQLVFIPTEQSKAYVRIVKLDPTQLRNQIETLKNKQSNNPVPFDSNSTSVDKEKK